MAANDDDDGLRPARGITNGVILGALLWIAVAVLVIWLSGCGGADSPPADKTCYVCAYNPTGTFAGSQQAYSCTQSEWQREGVPCSQRRGIRY